jgi:hypothetical protein
MFKITQNRRALQRFNCSWLQIHKNTDFNVFLSIFYNCFCTSCRFLVLQLIYDKLNSIKRSKTTINPSAFTHTKLFRNKTVNLFRIGSLSNNYQIAYWQVDLILVKYSYSEHIDWTFNLEEMWFVKKLTQSNVVITLIKSNSMLNVVFSCCVVFFAINDYSFIFNIY